jgi:hypothetical protein
MPTDLSFGIQGKYLPDGAADWWLLRDRRTISALLLVVGFALFLRIVAYLLADGVDHVGDAPTYQLLAERIRDGQGLSLPRPGIDGLTPTALFPPLPPMLLAAAGSMAPLSAASLTIFNSVIDCCSALLLARLGAQLGRRDIGAMAALAYLAWPSIALMAPLAYKEGMLIALLLATLVCLIEQVRKGGHRWAALSGLSGGMVALCQPGVASVLPLLFLATRPAFGSWRRWLVVSLVAALVATIVMLPWWVRNAMVFGHFIPLTSSSGLALWVGAHPDGGIVWQAPPAAWANAPELMARDLAQNGAWQIIAADPMAYVTRCLAKLPRTFFMTNWAADQLLLVRPDIDISLVRFRSLRVLPTVLELGVVAMAIVGLARAPRSTAALLVYACLAQILLIGMWFEFSERHRLFMTPFLILLALFALIGGKPLDLLRPGGRLHGLRH